MPNVFTVLTLALAGSREKLRAAHVLLPLLPWLPSALQVLHRKFPAPGTVAGWRSPIFAGCLLSGAAPTCPARLPDGIGHPYAGSA